MPISPILSELTYYVSSGSLSIYCSLVHLFTLQFLFTSMQLNTFKFISSLNLYSAEELIPFSELLSLLKAEAKYWQKIACI